MERPILVTDAIRDQLRMVFLVEADLIGALQDLQLEVLAEPPGSFRCRPTIPVPRPLDPETAELRQLEVLLKPVEGGLEVFSVRGLGLESLES